jgi:hypothetical protein
VRTDQYGDFVNGFVKDGCVYLAFMKDEHNIDIYTVGKDIKLENRAAIGDFPTYPGIEQIIYVPGDTNSFYLLGSRQQLPRNPGEFMRDVLSGGHGLYYEKPIWTEMQGQKLLEYQKIPYGGKIDESYNIKEVLTGKEKVCFFGFRIQKQYRKWPTSNILHYAEYNVKKKKLVQAQDIYSDIPGAEYCSVSADNFDDNLFVVFSWHGISYPIGVNGLPKANIENINSPIYYSQSNGKTFSKAEVIGQGILPLVRADSLGNVHVIWANSNGDLVHRAKKDGKWGDEQIVLNGAIDTDKVWERSNPNKNWLRKMVAEFDKDNNLNVVFTSKGNLTYAKIRVN